MEKKRFLDEIEAKLYRQLSAARRGVVFTQEQRANLAGFVDAGHFLDLINNKDVSELYSRVYSQVYGMSEARHRGIGPVSIDELELNLAELEYPAYLRAKKPKH